MGKTIVQCTSQQWFTFIQGACRSKEYQQLRPLGFDSQVCANLKTVEAEKLGALASALHKAVNNDASMSQTQTVTVAGMMSAMITVSSEQKVPLVSVCVLATYINTCNSKELSA